jgi:TRAP-type mannitol/chloroaromatic compound transport system permease large subunit
VVQLYAGAFFPGFMLAGLYIGYIIVLAKWKPDLMPPLSKEERLIALPALAQTLAPKGSNALAGLWRALAGGANVSRQTAGVQLVISLLPALAIAAILGVTYYAATLPEVQTDTAGLVEAGGDIAGDVREEEIATGLSEAPGAAQEDAKAAAADAKAAEASKPAAEAQTATPKAAAPASQERLPIPGWFWIVFAIGVVVAGAISWLLNWERLEVFKFLLASFFPLAVLILAVLGSIVFGLSTPTEAAAVGAFGGFILAAAYRLFHHLREGAGTKGAAVTNTVKELGVITRESSFLTAKTSAMVCWLFVGSGIFSAAFALLGGQDLVEKWVLSLNMTPVQFMILAQLIIFILGWPLEWTEIIVIFMPIFIPLLPHFGIDPLFFGLLVALNLQTAFLSPPVAMAAFYLKGVSPPHVTLNQIFAGMMPFMGIQVIAVVLLYLFPGIGLWLPQVLYGR